MKLLITIEVDADEDHCEAVLDELDAIKDDGEIVHIKSASDTHVEFTIVDVKELPAKGRPPWHDQHQLTIHDAIEED
jgi:hypothetical protein